MKSTNLIYIVALVALLSCASEENKPTEVLASDTSVVEKQPDVSEEAVETSEESDLELNYIVSVAEGYNYDSLKTIALQTADKLSFKFDTLGRYYNPQKGIVLPDDDEDEMWAGEYFFRRNGENLVSVEMSYAYTDTSISNNEPELEKHRQDTTKMFVLAMMYLNKKSADSLANIIKVDYPSAKVFPAQIYMGCMH
ncbi:MAG: hypothetical protein J7604_20095 [Sporocytophaga sp.]|uniref:hypothetical protein n=1 Tax=Sporocytophaga sp. TaxID=2231183 RepID=UPI001B2E4E74|nr:hypothetical protein [Sporocytophaga sp.]MBO9702523.1 hypothetical protein [Sporocytophaga sp.]